MKSFTTKSSLTAASFIAVSLTGMTNAATLITDLFNTGVDASGATTGATDPHYQIVSNPGTISSSTPGAGFVQPFWVANQSDSRWIGPDENEFFGPSGQYVYQTTFSLPTNADLATVVIAGLAAADNTLTAIRINGVGPTTNIDFDDLVGFSLDSQNTSFQHGQNVMEFVVENGGGNTNWTGLQVNFGTAEFTAVPEPTTLISMLIPCLALVGMRSRK